MRKAQVKVGVAFGLAAVLCLGTVACSSDSKPDDASSATTQAPGDPTSTGSIAIETVSTKPQFVTGGDVLIEATLPDGADATSLAVEIDGTSADATFEPVEGDPAKVQGIVEGLPDGEAIITVTSGDESGELTVTNHPITGPVFSGSHQTPFVCTTFALGLGEPTDSDCSAPTTTETKATTKGQAYTLEKGVIDRSAYTLAFPASADWNGRLVYRFGGGCGTSFSQGGDFTGVEGADLLDAGYAVVTSTLNTFQTACNDVLSAEVVMMVKEHIAERYGVPDLTIGDGGSGGAIQQFLIAQNYPGLLDGLATSVPFPDAVSISAGVTDCGLLLHYYGSPDGSALTAEQRQAINGHLTTGTCELWAQSFLPAVDPTNGCSPDLPQSEIYNADTNPTGARCTMQDSVVNLVGRDPATGFANRPLDNTGVAYGLQALADGSITADQFVALNEKIGGYDVDGKFVAEREAAADEVFEHVYATGRITTGDSSLQDVPIIATNVYTDPDGDIHDRQRVFAIRERLAVDGVADPNYVVWTQPATGDLMGSLTGSLDQVSAVVTLDEWLTAAKADTSDGAWPEKLASSKPAAAVDTCTLPDGTTATGDDIYADGSPCATAYPVKSDPRRVAGAPLANDIVDCLKQPVAALNGPGPHGGTVTLTDDQISRLEVVFPDGVCDWTQPGVGQVPLEGTWLTY